MNEKVVIEMTFDEYEEYKKQKKIEEYSVEELVEILLRRDELKKKEEVNSVAANSIVGYIYEYAGKDYRLIMSLTKDWRY